MYTHVHLHCRLRLVCSVLHSKSPVRPPSLVTKLNTRYIHIIHIEHNNIIVPVRLPPSTFPFFLPIPHPQCLPQSLLLYLPPSCPSPPPPPLFLFLHFPPLPLYLPPSLPPSLPSLPSPPSLPPGDGGSDRPNSRVSLRLCAAALSLLLPPSLCHQQLQICSVGWAS